MVLLRAFQFWQKARFEGWEQSFCRKNYISAAVFDIVTTVRTQLLGQLRASGFVKARGSGDIRDLNTYSENWAVVKAALVAGMYDNLAHTDPESGNLIVAESSCKSSAEGETESHNMVHPSPLSVLTTNPADTSPVDLKKLPPHWLVYDRLIGQCCLKKDGKSRDNYDGQGKNYNLKRTKGRGKMSGGLKRKLLHCVTVVSPFTTALVAGPIRSAIICTSGKDNVYDSRQADENVLSKETGRGKAGLLTQLEIDCTANSPNKIAPYFEAMVRPGSDDMPTQLQEASSGKQQALNGKLKRKPTVTLRFDGANGILVFDCEVEVARLLSDLRQKWCSLLLRRLRNPGKPCQQQDEAILSTIVAVLSAEEQVLGLRQPTGVGARPRPMATELCNQNDTNTSATASGNTHVLTTENWSGDTIVHSNLMPMLESCLPTTRFSRGEHEGRIIRKFSEGDGDGNSPDQLHCNGADLVMTKCRAKMWGDGTTDPFTQMKIPATQSVLPEQIAMNFKSKSGQIQARIDNQKNRWDSCCCTTNLVQTGNKVGPTSRGGTETHTLTASGPSTNNAIFGNPALVISNIPFESLQPLG